MVPSTAKNLSRVACSREPFPPPGGPQPPHGHGSKPATKVQNPAVEGILSLKYSAILHISDLGTETRIPYHITKLIVARGYILGDIRENSLTLLKR